MSELVFFKEFYDQAVRQLELPELIIGALAALFALPFFLRKDWPEEDWKGGTGTSLVMVSVVGMLLVASNRSSVQMFIGYEMIIVGCVGLLFGSALPEERKREQAEAALKFFLLGQLMAALLILALSLPNGLGSLLALLSFGFLAGLFPVHFAQPDVAQAAPRGVGAFILAGTKLAGLLALFHFWADHPNRLAIERTICLMAWFSVLIGGLAAANQRNVRRMLGYGSICQSGLIVGSMANARGLADADFVALEIPLVAYGLALFLAFHVLELAESALEGQETHRLAGLWQRNPVLASGLGVALLSLVGLPPAIGFVGNWAIWQQTWTHYAAVPYEGLGMMSGMAIGQLTLFYGFLSIFKNMFWSAPRNEAPLVLSPRNAVLIKLLIGLVLAGGIWQGWTILARVSY